MGRRHPVAWESAPPVAPEELRRLLIVKAVAREHARFKHIFPLHFERLEHVVFVATKSR